VSTGSYSASARLGRRGARSLPRPLARLFVYPELLGLLAVTGVLNLWNLSLNGFANTYYAAAVKSMSTSWHDFLFASMDKSGLMTVDKPPLALWIQALSARIFGFDSWSILVPQALMGIAATALMYDLMRRRFGRAAGSIAGLALATTPIIVAMSRHNNPDELLVLCTVAAIWFVLRALEDGRTKWLVWAGVCIGLGFETKMAAALMVVPAMALAYFWVAPRGRWRSAAAERWRRDGDRRARVAAARDPDAGRRPAVDLGHRRQQHLVADLRLQRPRSRRRSIRRPERARRRRRRRGVRRLHRDLPAAQLESRRPGGLAARLRDCRGDRARRALAPTAQ
jgi:hypothetical protein